jgi:predicted transcriptional regulator
MESDSENTEKFRALKAALDEGMADVAAGRVVPWNLQDILREARERIATKPK